MVLFPIRFLTRCLFTANFTTNLTVRNVSSSSKRYRHHPQNKLVRKFLHDSSQFRHRQAPAQELSSSAITSLTSRFRKSFKIGSRMSSSSPESQDMLDLLAYNCSKLSNDLWEATNLNEKRKLVVEYLKSADRDGKSIKDFREDLDWFNVTEPLSFEKALRGKIVVLDFFTYCCINCMHILPDLKRLEHLYSIEDGLVVIGVHSAKFENERDSRNIRCAVQRYEITHPVVNDNVSSMWRNLRVQCWPTLLILGPRANPLFVVMGEGHFDDLKLYVSSALKFYKDKGAIANHSLPINLTTNLTESSHLQFPGKISCSFRGCDSNDNPLYAISDSGNHRILIVNSEGTVLHRVGGKKPGFIDGDFRKARFNAPQGVAFQSDEILFVADNENHAIRKINLKNKLVSTVVGNGKQGCDRIGGKSGHEQVISSPWDVAVYRTRDLDMSFHSDESKVHLKDVVFVAMAGIHQIWALFLEDTIWWKFKKYSANNCMAIAGNGREENRNNTYPNNAAFAQPSGLAINRESKELYLADSESSSIRKVSLSDGKVMPVAGGDRNPLDLFSFGDVDGKQYAAKFQHPLGVTYNPKDNCIYLTDTYNHKIKKINATTNVATTCLFTEEDGSVKRFSEPGGLCVDPTGRYLYIADTNNHQIAVADLSDMSIRPLKIRFGGAAALEADQTDVPGEVHVYEGTFKVLPEGGKVQIKLEFGYLESNIKLTEEAPQRWTLALPSDKWRCDTMSGTLSSLNDGLTLTVVIPKGSEQQKPVQGTVNFQLNLCANDVCFPKEFAVGLNFVHDVTGLASVKAGLMVQIGRKSVVVSKE
ncbi:NHL repeat-containing protein 2 isoform X1 [Wyeomyia smithii]|uniref:NHL repeat-containing protein 2 isoform X1 n=2 Tax=Wyeomyia smithii TaxID=174621 RepID=UPI002467B32C|nr:NHL repeat-containing protein 2 isoform X1 [Wyeomyia smithii]